MTSTARMAAGLAAIVALAAISAISAVSTVETRAAGDAHGPTAIRESAVATLTARPTAQIRAGNAQRPGVAAALLSGPVLLVLALAGAIAASTSTLRPAMTRVDIRRRAPPSRFA